MARNYAAIPYDYGREMSRLSDAEFGRLVRALLKYSETGEPIDLRGNESYFTERVMMQEDRFRESYDDLSKTRSDAGKAGASKRWQTMANDGKRWQTDGKNGNTETKTKTETDISATIVADITRARFAPPSVDEVEAYCHERGNSVDPAQFVDFYASKGWKVGREPMKDWKAAVRTWEQRDKKPAGKPGYRAQPHNGTLGEYERAAVERLMQDG
jgi:hypothetical protein